MNTFILIRSSGGIIKSYYLDELSKEIITSKDVLCCHSKLPNNIKWKHRIGDNFIPVKMWHDKERGK